MQTVQSKIAMQIAAALLLLIYGPTQAGGQAPSTRALDLGDRASWRFLGGDWTQDEKGVIFPPARRHLHSRAFFIDEAYGDVTVEFDYFASYSNNGQGNFGLILRAQDGGRFYYVHFPWGGQAYRAKHYWAGVGVQSGDEYVRNIRLAYIPNVPSETERQYHVKVVAEGPRIRVWVDGRRALDVTDKTYVSGMLGFAGYGWYGVRNIRVTGRAAKPPRWSDAGLTEAWANPDANNCRPPAVELPTSAYSKMPAACIAPNGDVLLVSGTQMFRSRDRGRTWSDPVAVHPHLGDISDYRDTLFTTPDKRLLLMRYRVRDATHPDAPVIVFSESTDNGHTWLGTPEKFFVAFAGQVEQTGWPDPPRTMETYGPVIQTASGVWLRLLFGGRGVIPDDALHQNVVTWGAVQCRAFAVRSADQGMTWSSAIELDQPAFYGMPRGSIPGALDLTEPTGVAIGETVMVLVRPIYSAHMWQCWSYDAGETWDAASRTTFPGYAQSMLRLESGPIICAHRFPLYSVNVSRDDGVNWDEGTIIDYPAWAMGCLLEVEPDVVLCIYLSTQLESPLRAQRFHVTADGLFSIPPGE